MGQIIFYVNDADEKMVRDAVGKLGEKSMSAAIVSAVKQALSMKEAEQEGFEKVELKVGTVSGRMGESDNIQTVRFIGKEVAFHRSLDGQTSSGDDRGVSYTLYRTQKGKYLLHIADWSNWQGESSHYRYEVFDTLQDLSEEGLPGGLIQEAKESLGEDPVVELDI